MYARSSTHLGSSNCQVLESFDSRQGTSPRGGRCSASNCFSFFALRRMMLRLSHQIENRMTASSINLIHFLSVLCSDLPVDGLIPNSRSSASEFNTFDLKTKTASRSSRWTAHSLNVGIEVRQSLLSLDIFVKSKHAGDGMRSAALRVGAGSA